MLISFTLTMPGRGSWDGKWSGQDRSYVVIKSYRNPPEVDGKPISGRSYYYRWEDGWGASVSVAEVSPDDARRLRKKSSGFCGYNWMIDSILQYGKIYATHERPVVSTTSTE